MTMQYMWKLSLQIIAFTDIL